MASAVLLSLLEDDAVQALQEQVQAGKDPESLISWLKEAQGTSATASDGEYRNGQPVPTLCAAPANTPGAAPSLSTTGTQASSVPEGVHSWSAAEAVDAAMVARHTTAVAEDTAKPLRPRDTQNEGSSLTVGAASCLSAASNDEVETVPQQNALPEAVGSTPDAAHHIAVAQNDVVRPGGLHVQREASSTMPSVAPIPVVAAAGVLSGPRVRVESSTSLTPLEDVGGSCVPATAQPSCSATGGADVSAPWTLSASSMATGGSTPESMLTSTKACSNGLMMEPKSPRTLLLEQSGAAKSADITFPPASSVGPGGADLCDHSKEPLPSSGNFVWETLAEMSEFKGAAVPTKIASRGKLVRSSVAIEKISDTDSNTTCSKPSARMGAGGYTEGAHAKMVTVAYAPSVDSRGLKPAVAEVAKELDALVEGRSDASVGYSEAWLQPKSTKVDDSSRPVNEAVESSNRAGGKGLEAGDEPFTGGAQYNSMDAISRAIKAGVDKEVLKRYIDEIAERLAGQEGKWVRQKGRDKGGQGNSERVQEGLQSSQMKGNEEEARRAGVKGSLGKYLKYGPDPPPATGYDMKADVRAERAARSREQSAKEALLSAAMRGQAGDAPPGAVQVRHGEAAVGVSDNAEERLRSFVPQNWDHVEDGEAAVDGLVPAGGKRQSVLQLGEHVRRSAVGAGCERNVTVRSDQGPEVVGTGTADAGAEFAHGEAREELGDLQEVGCVLGKEHGGNGSSGREDARQSVKGGGDGSRGCPSSIGDSTDGERHDDVGWGATGRLKGMQAGAAVARSVPWAAKGLFAQQKSPARDTSIGNSGKGEAEPGSGQGGVNEGQQEAKQENEGRLESVPGGFSRLAGRMESRDMRFTELGPYETIASLGAIEEGEYGGAEEVLGDDEIVEAFAQEDGVSGVGTLKLEGFEGGEVEEEPQVMPDDAPEQLDIPEWWIEADRAAEEALLQSVQVQQGGENILEDEVKAEQMEMQRASKGGLHMEDADKINSVDLHQEQHSDYDMKRARAKDEQTLVHVNAKQPNHMDQNQSSEGGLTAKLVKGERVLSDGSMDMRIAEKQVTPIQTRVGEASALPEAVFGSTGWVHRKQGHWGQSEETADKADEGSTLGDANEDEDDKEEYEEEFEDDDIDWLLDDEDDDGTAAEDTGTFHEALLKMKENGLNLADIGAFSSGNVQAFTEGASQDVQLESREPCLATSSTGSGERGESGDLPGVHVKSSQANQIATAAATSSDGDEGDLFNDGLFDDSDLDVWGEGLLADILEGTEGEKGVRSHE
jgi:hypothetical protein